MLIKEGWQTLIEELKSLAAEGRGLRYVPNAGNAGDALICAGTWQLFDDLRLKPRLSHPDEIGRGDVAIYGGGGNLVSEYDECAEFLEICMARRVKRALVLSQSVRGHEKLLRRLDDRFTIACREDESLERVRASETGATIIFAPDLALRIDAERLFARCRELPVRARLMRDLTLNGRVPAYLKWRSRLLRLAMECRSTLHIIRADVEAVAGVTGPARWDVSGLYWSDYLLRSEAEFVARDLLELVQTSREVVTNRLHAGVAAALVGRRVTYTDNSYGKIRAVYNSSLKGIEGVQFESAPTRSYVPASTPAAERAA